MDIAQWYRQEFAESMATNTVFPLVVPIAGTHLVFFTITIPQNELWELTAMSVGLVFDVANLTISSSLLTILRGGITVAIPAQIAGLVAITPALLIQGYSSLFLSGVEAQSGDVLSIAVAVSNSDVGLAHNVTAGNGQVLFRRNRLTSTIGLSQEVENRSRLGIS